MWMQMDVKQQSLRLMLMHGMHPLRCNMKVVILQIYALIHFESFSDFKSLYVFSNNPNWIEVKKHIIEYKLNMSNRDGLPAYYDSYNPEELEKVIDTHSKFVDYQQKNKRKNISEFTQTTTV